MVVLKPSWGWSGQGRRAMEKFMYRGKCQGVLTPEERKGVRVDAGYIGAKAIEQGYETQPAPINCAGRS